MTKDDDESGVRMADPATHDAFYEITTAKARYCYTLDTRDWTGFGDLMTDDVVLDVSEGTGVPVVHGRESAVEMIRSSLTNARSAHQVHTPLIEVDGDGADGVGCTPVIWGSSRSRVGCASSGARRTCSSSAASTPTPPRSKASCCSTRPSRRRRSSACPTSVSVRSERRSWCCARRPMRPPRRIWSAGVVSEWPDTRFRVCTVPRRATYERHGQGRQGSSALSARTARKQHFRRMEADPVLRRWSIVRAILIIENAILFTRKS
ncbi:MAG: hypothetical protein QOI01_5923 [Mycobacterium sp.]|nr:hypothetical protein [Mycobacterium sp.]